jgi:hypothetical protein
MWRTLRDISVSLRTAVWLLLLELLLLLAGAVLMPRDPAYEGMNGEALLGWVRGQPPAITWWLWASVAVLALLAANTVACGIESLRTVGRGRPLLPVLAPQIVHIGFLLMLMGHLAGAVGARKGMVSVAEGSALSLPGGIRVDVRALDIAISPEGYPTNWGADIAIARPGGRTTPARLGPNRPAFVEGYGVYLKTVQPGASGTAGLIEVTREPGAPWALAGGVLFTMGSVLLMYHKVRRER